jgi:hypothetical protein
MDALLGQMTDLNRLTKKPWPNYRAEQNSSYDRSSLQPETESWFANRDSGNFAGEEVREGRTEHVLASLRGPGTVVRIWSANPVGVIRFYFDGEAKPRIEAKFSELFTGKVPPFKAPYAYVSAKGHNLYFPIPYSQSLKITVDESDPGWKELVYHVGSRRYDDETVVRTYSQVIVEALGKRIGEVGRQLTQTEDRRLPPTRWDRTPVLLAAGETFQKSVERPSSAIYELHIKPEIQRTALPWENPANPVQWLRKVRLRASFDNEIAIDVPLGDFFGSSPGLNVYNSLPMEIRADGTMICRFVMPWQTSS